MKHYLKEIISRDVYVAGARIKFEDFGDGNGGVKTENPIIIQELDRLVAAGKGGLVRVSAEEYEEAKKKSQAVGATGNNKRGISLAQLGGTPASKPRSCCGGHRR